MPATLYDTQDHLAELAKGDADRIERNATVTRVINPPLNDREHDFYAEYRDFIGWGSSKSEAIANLIAEVL